MLKNAPTLAIVAVHTEENEPPRILIWNTTNIYIFTILYPGTLSSRGGAFNPPRSDARRSSCCFAVGFALLAFTASLCALLTCCGMPLSSQRSRRSLVGMTCTVLNVIFYKCFPRFFRTLHIFSPKILRNFGKSSKFRDFEQFPSNP